jgi:hypothetical protein
VECVSWKRTNDEVLKAHRQILKWQQSGTPCFTSLEPASFRFAYGGGEGSAVAGAKVHGNIAVANACGKHVVRFVRFCKVLEPDSMDSDGIW